MNEPAGDLDAPPHAARQVLHLRFAPLRQLDELEELRDQLLAFLARHAVQLREDQQVFLDAQLEVRRQRLRDDADRLAHAVRVFRDIEAVDERRP